MIPYSTQSIDEDDIQALNDVLRGSHLTQGSEVEAFEREIAAYIGVKHAITFNSATSALHGAYHSAGIGKDDEIITTPITFVATSNMAIELGAKPVFCDVKLDGNIDERFIEPLITPQTKAIVPVDFAGKSVEIETIQDIAKKHKLLVIDDACHAFGAEYKNKKVGSFADMTVFSFHAIKPFTTGEGGCVVTNSDAYAQKLRLFRSHGMVKKQLWSSDMVQMGHNYRLTDFAAALGRSQLKKVDHFIEKRDIIARYYDERFKNHKLFTPVAIEDHIKSSHHLYPIVLSPVLHCPKEDIYRALHVKGIGVQVHYKPLYKNSFYEKRYGTQSLHVSEDFYKSELSLPCHQKMTLDDARYIADTLLEILDSYHLRGCGL
ncbi:MAG: UDP-4-amino-4,6-dideoxy-N-acetyl-beta-L-altrosamine transaminase [Campylobacterota bacterium]|nr:UDP-4-amino-4,6-dideoxy-N-acetyl-beta-L-altrosamine transaminase [Campylobacterota bacterium]